MQDYFPQVLQTIQSLPSDAAIEQLQHAANLHPSDARPLLLVAAEYAQTRRIDEAEAAYIAALQRAPDFAIARFQLGLLQFTSARPAAAYATWAPLGGLDPSHPLRLFKTGLEYLGVDRFDDAQHWLQQGIANNQDNPALNHDMRRVINEIVKLRSNQPTLGAAPSNDETQTAEGQAAGEHFLISAYSNTH